MKKNKPMIKIIAKRRKDSHLAFIAQKYTNKLLKDNPDFLPELQKLAGDIVVFKLKWGIDLTKDLK